MFSFVRKAFGGSPALDYDRDNLVRDEYIKKQLKEELAAAIKKLQKEHINTDHEIERNDENAQHICTILEAIFLHGYQDKKTGFRGFLNNPTEEEVESVSFWDLVKEITHNDVIIQLTHLSVSSKVGLCKAWIRLAMNDGLMESYIDAIERNRDNLRQYYSPNAFLMDVELPSITIELLQGLMEFQFHLNYNSSKLNTWTLDPLRLAGILPPEKKKKPEQLSATSLSQMRPERQDVKDETPDPINERLTMVTERLDSLKERKMTVNADELHTQAPATENSSTVLDQVPTTGSSTMTGKSSVASENPSEPELEQEQEQEHVSLSSSSYESSPVNARVSFPGNRISVSGDGWNGWSSAFSPEANQSRLVESTGGAETTDGGLTASMQASFGTLLMRYGVGSQAPSASPVGQPPPPGNIGTTSSGIIEGTKSPTSPSEDDNVHQMNYEVVPLSSSLHHDHTDEKTQFLLDHLTVIGIEKGLDKQSFQCKGCGRPIGLIYGPYRVCYFDGGYYCCDCHEDEEHVIPAKIIQNWDFRPYKVSKYTKVFLMKIEEEPLFHIDEINPTLYNAVVDLNEVKMLRIQLQYLKGYILTCKHDLAEDFRRRLWPREYLSDDVHQFSMLDLVQVHTGQLANHLKKIILQFSKHVYRCSLCSQKGFVCEVCNDPRIIYPFEVLHTVQCHRCLALYHKKCKKDRRCPKCIRLRFRTRKDDEKPNINAPIPREDRIHSDSLYLIASEIL